MAEWSAAADADNDDPLFADAYPEGDAWVMAPRKLPKISTFDVPPDGFDPSAASDSELARYGFPRRPTQPRQRAAYEQIFAGLRGKLKVVTPKLGFHPEGIAGRPLMLRFDNNLSWSGVVVSPPKGDSFDWVFGRWVVPHVGVPTDDQTYYCGSWVGIGGMGSDLVQAGVSSKSWTGSDGGWGFGPFELFAWLEWTPNAAVTISNLTINEGDTVAVWVEPNGAAATAASVLFVNLTTSTATSLSIDKPGDATWRADSAEWIVERPDSGSVAIHSLTQLADFGTLVFHSADSGTHSGESIGAGNGTTLNMTDDQGRVIATGSIAGPTTAQCDYVNPWVGWAQIGSGVFTQRTPIGAAVHGSDLDLYAVGEDGPVYTSWWRGGPNWSNWAKIRSTTFPQRTPIAAVARGSHRDLFAVHADALVYTAWWRGGPDWGGWAPIGQTQFAPFTPVSVVARGSDLDLFAVATDGRVHTAWWRGGPDWGGWAPIGTMTFSQLTPVTALARGSDLDLFAVQPDSRVVTAYWRGGPNWHGWGEIGGAVFEQTTKVAAAARGSYIDLFAVTMDGHPYSAWWRGGPGWQGWEQVDAGVFTQLTPLSAVARGSNLDVFGVGTDSRLYSAWWRDGATTWEGWKAIGSVTFTQQTPVTALTHDDTDLDLFAVDPNGHVLTAWLNVP